MLRSQVVCDVAKWDVAWLSGMPQGRPLFESQSGIPGGFLADQ
jgi:hypothetical protein